MLRYLLLTSLLICCWSLVGAVEIQLREHVVLQRERVQIGDVAEIQGIDTERFEAIAALTLRRLPDLNQYRISANEVRNTIRRHLQIATVVSGESVVQRASERLSAEELGEHAVRHLEQRAEDRDINVRIRREASPIVVPADDLAALEIRAEPLTDAWWGDVPYRLRVLRGQQELARTLVILEVHAWREMPVALRPLARNTTISLHDVGMQRVQVSPGQGERGLSLEEVVGQVTIRHVPPGTVIGPGWARPEDDVKQGTTVLMVYDGGGFTLAMHVEALTAGSLGDRVRVRPEHGRSVYAVVSGPNEVRLTATP